MIIYNTVMGVLAGLIMLLAADVVKKIHRDDSSELHAHGLMLLWAGVPLTALSFLMTVTWPLNVNPPINIAFGEPCLMLGALAAVGGLALLRRRRVVDLRPAALCITAVGGVLALTASAIFSYDLVGDAPSAEPISGQFRGWENTTWGVAYAVAALGCLVTWFLARGSDIAYHIVRWSWILSGLFFLLFSILNYRTHIGLLINITRGTHYRW